MTDHASSSLDRELRNLREDNDRLRSRLTQMSEMVLRIASSLDTSTVLQEVVNAACDLTGARYGALGVFDEAGKVQKFITHGISEEERAGIGDLPTGHGLLGFLHHVQQPIRLADLGKHPRSVGFPANHPRMKTFLGAPLRYLDTPLGNLYLTEKTGGVEFTPEDEQVLVLFAAHAALAIFNSIRFEREKKAEQAAESERRLLKAFIDASPVGVAVIDAGSRRITMINREAERILSDAYSLGNDVQESRKQVLVKHPDGREYDREDLPVERALNKGETVRAEEVRFEFPDGRSVPTLVSATPLFAPESAKVASAILVVQDVTPIEEMERLRNEFLGMVSHELRTPLTAIKGSAATVLGSKRPFGPLEVREFFQIIDEQADRLRDLVNNLLDLTRIEAGRLSVNPEPMGLEDVLEEAEATFRQGGGQQEIRVTVQDGLPLVKADRLRVVQVLNNLLSNSAKFSPGLAPVTIDIAYDRALVTLRVADRGRGIAADKLPHLFRKFSQVHGDTQNKLSGSGLGLAICKGIIEAHGGRIWAESAGEGQGTTFVFTLPVAAETPVAQVLEISRASAHLGKVRKSRERARILAVDDEPQVLRLLHNTLDAAGFHPVTTGNPNEMMRLLETEEPVLVLLDLNLPGTTGFELLKRVREVSGVPVIILSARDEEDITVKALKMGADDYVGKPFAPSELVARIEASLRRRVAPDQTEVRPRYQMADLVIDYAGRRVTVGSIDIKLTATEYKLLFELSSNAGKVLTHDQILHRVWGPEYSGETQLVRAFIRNLRRKLGDDALKPHLIFTEPQVGYKMAKPQSGAPASGSL